MAQSSIQNILVGLDLSSMDAHILSFLSQHHKALTTEKIYFIHVEEKLSTNSDSGSERVSSDRPKEDIAEALSDKVENSIPKTIVDYDVRLVKGDPEKEIRQWSKAQEIDLTVLGHKRTTDHDVEAKKLVKKPSCSLLLVPERKDYNINTICVSIDFSELSHRCLKEAESIAENMGAELIGFHSYQVPSGYHKSGKDHREFAKIMEDNARKEAQTFLQKADLGHIKMEYAYDEKKQPADCIAQFVHDRDIDFLIVGSKGRTGPASILIGSVAKELTQLLHDTPLLIIKEKNENMDVVDALKKV